MKNRRQFIKRGALFVPLIFVPKLIRAQTVGRTPAFVGASKVVPPSGAACATLQIDNAQTNSGDQQWTFYNYLAFPFLTNGGFTCCAIDLRIFQASSPSGTLVPNFYNNNVTVPGTLNTAGSAVSKSLFPTSDSVYYNYTGISAALSATTIYWLVLFTATLDSAFTFRWIAGASAGSSSLKGSTDGSSWDNLGTIPMDFKLYSA